MTGAEVHSTSFQHKTIEKASKTPNPFEPFANEFATVPVGDQIFNTYCKWKNQMDAKTLKWAFKLAEANVGPFYRDCSIGWQPKVTSTANKDLEVTPKMLFLFFF